MCYLNSRWADVMHPIENTCAMQYTNSYICHAVWYKNVYGIKFFIGRNICLFLLDFGDTERTEELKDQVTYLGISPTIKARC
jgi:hypothetical protein